jgi:fatty acid desaturase
VTAALLRDKPLFFAWNLGLLAACAVAGNAWAWLLVWVVPSLTGLSLVFRLRNIAEHAVVRDPSNRLTNTRTTLAHPLACFFVAPHHANFHIEHHLFPFLPHHKLPDVHRLLQARGALEGAEVARGYLEVWRKAASGQGSGGGVRRDFIGVVPHG